MAKRIDIELTELESRTGAARYPWKKWADGATWLLVRGEDFNVSPASMRSAASNWARGHGLKLIASIQSSSQICTWKGEAAVPFKYEGLLVMFSPKTEEEKKTPPLKRAPRRAKPKSKPNTKHSK